MLTGPLIHMKLLDFHTHIFPETLAERALSQMSAVSGLTPATNGTKDGLLASMKRCGIDASVLMPVATKPTQVEKMNEIALSQNGKDNLYSFGAMHLDYAPKAEEFRRIADGGLKGIKLHFDYMRRFIDDEDAVQTINLAFEAGLAVLVHAGFDPVSPEIHYSSAERIAALLPKLTKGKLILAHFGALFQAEQAFSLLSDKDVYLDISSGYAYDEPALCRKILTAHDPDKLLYGSDSPWFPQDEPKRILEAMELPDALLHKICHENAEALLGIR